MHRRAFIRGSAIVGASLVFPPLLTGSSGMFSMRGYRKVYRILSADSTTVGTLPILRAFAGNHLDHVSPYVLFDEFGPVHLTPGSDPLRVDAHPHAGIVPTTYFLSGSGHHKDSLNYDIQVGKGDFMMFSSGKGAIHMEETGQKLYNEGGEYHGFQIWLNIPAKHKFIDPSTSVHREYHMDTIIQRDYTAKVVLGELFGARSQIQTITPAFYFHITMKANARLDIPTQPTDNAFIYMIDGHLELADRKQLKPNQLALYERGEHRVNLYSKDGAEFLLLGGRPLNEPVYSYGPFVMNNEDQINWCIQSYRAGQMGDPAVVNR